MGLKKKRSMTINIQRIENTIMNNRKARPLLRLLSGAKADAKPNITIIARVQ